MDVNEIIACVAYKYNGDWDSIYQAIKNYEKEDWENYLPAIRKLKCKYVSINSEEYPQYLKSITKPPFCLFYYGDLSLMQNPGKNIAVVGSRNCSEYGLEITRKIVNNITPDYVVVSGLASGIDGAAHLAAIENGGKTIAILGTGIDVCYPSSNKELYDIIKEKHLVISEHPQSTFSSYASFPFRNRLIIALTKALVVTEAHSHSGTLTTVFHALEANKPVFCVPYRADEESECNRLINDGTEMILNSNEVKEKLDKIKYWSPSIL